MIKPLRVAVWLRRSCVALVLCSGAIAAAPSLAQETAAGAAAGSQKQPGDSRFNLDPRTNGANLVHGNYCGLGSRPGKSPIDALDVACMHHDACTPDSGIPDCDCNIQLLEEATAVARDPRQPSELQIMAQMIASAARVMVCKPIINRAAAPPAPVPARPRNVPPADIPTANLPPANAPATNVPAAGAPTANVPTTAPLPVTSASNVPPAAAAAAPEAPAPMNIAPVPVAPAADVPATEVPAPTAPVQIAPVPTAPEPRNPSVP